MSEPDVFQPVNRGEPCAICGKPDWCRRSAAGAHECHRIDQAAANEYERVATTPGGFAVYRLPKDQRGGDSKSAGSNKGREQPVNKVNLAAEDRRFRVALSSERKSFIALQLGVSVAALDSIGIGRADERGLRRLRASGGGWRENFPPVVSSFPECDATGAVVGFCFRADDGRKGAPSGKVGARRGLIIPSTLPSRPDPVLLVEGPTDVAACETLGLAAVGRPSNASGGSFIAQLLARREVLIVGENDQNPAGTWPGREGAEKLANHLATKWKRKIRWALPPEGFKDVRSYLQVLVANGLDLNDELACHEAGKRFVAILTAAASEVQPPASSFRERLGDGRASEAGDDRSAVTPGSPYEWPDPQPLPGGLPPVMPFDFDLLPSSLRPWIKDIAERIQCPPDFPAIAAMIAVAAVVGRKIGIRPKCNDDWLVVPNLWGAAIGPPSVMKTPAIQEPLKPLKRLEIEAKSKFDAEMKEYEARQLVADQRKQLAKTAIRRALASEDSDPLVVARDAIENDTLPPIRRRYLVNDSTVEKLGEILNENPNGVLCFRDELVGLLKSLDKEGQEGARSFYLEAWNGTGRYTYDRIGRGTIDIEAAIVSLIGSIQPGPLQSYLRGAVSGDENADGLMQRFQLAVYPDISPTWRNVDRWPDTEAKNLAYDVICALDRLEPSAVGARSDDDDAIPYLHFASQAQCRFDEWRGELEHRLRSDDEHPVIVAHLAKYRSLIPSLALLCHLAERRTGPVGLDSLERAIAWGRYLESHARRIFASAVVPGTSEAIALAQKIRAGKLPDEFALRDVYRNRWIGLETRDAAERAAEILLDLDWLVQINEPTDGRPRSRYLVNPRVERRASAVIDKTQPR